ncbi:MAG: NAD(P)/FAD-dependent oxidoreductase [Rhodobacteraceae bacterium]|nr:NAD(P)/FAD-dependent oxidoreductase [Paracoccaceae bacterium]
MQRFDVIILGAGAAGMFCAIEAGRRGRQVALIDHARAPGEKIRISGGGRCNFTNLDIAPEKFLSQNPRFALSALRRYTQHDFIERVRQAGIAFHEKTLGQLFCDGSSRQIVSMLVSDLQQAGVQLYLGTAVSDVSHGDGFTVTTAAGTLHAPHLVVATGGKSIPKMGASGFGYQLAEQFGHRLVETRPALVPLTFSAGQVEEMKPLAGVSVHASVACGKTRFLEGMLFTHRGLSGPSILQISSYWREGQAVVVDLAPGLDSLSVLADEKHRNGRQAVHTALGKMLPEKLARQAVQRAHVQGNLADQSKLALARVRDAVHQWQVVPVGTEGYRTAEVTLGGVDTKGLDAKTMESRSVRGLFFIGEVVDVTGWLGGYNFQWAWSSGWAAGQVA